MKHHEVLENPCLRKRHYPSYAAAKEHLTSLRANPWDDPTLNVYQCPNGTDGHYHVGHATGAEAQRLRKHAERLRKRRRETEPDASGPRGTVTR